jgi:hypothetical protein
VITEPPSKPRLSAQADEHAKEFPFQHLIEMAPVDDAGRVIARRTSRFIDEPEKAVAAKKTDMLRLAGDERQLKTLARIALARQVFENEHAVRADDFHTIKRDNPFVPPEREGIFARGLHAGLIGDFAVASHLLFPQIEAKLRQSVEQRGGIVSTIDEVRGIQELEDLNKLLYREDIADIFDEDTVFDLQGLLVEQFGSNLRNRLAHGLLQDDELFMPEIYYLWWLVLRFCCWPLLVRHGGDIRENVNDAEEES